MAGFNISGFRSNGLVRGGARPNQFSVSLNFPSLVATPGVEQKLTFTCRSANIPESMIRPVEIPYFGRKIKVAGDREFGDWEVRIMNDEDFIVRNALEAWHNSINTIISNRLDERVASINPALGDSYKTVATVTQFSKIGPGEIDGEGAIKTYEFNGIFPINISPMRLDWDNNNQIQEFDVTFAYDWYIPLERANDQPIFPVELNPA